MPDLSEDNVTYLAVPTLLITQGKGIGFDVYLETSKSYILYAKAGDFTPQRRQRLHDNGVKEVFIQTKDQLNYEQYIETNFSELLNDKKIDIETRSHMLYDYSCNITKKLFQFTEKELPGNKYYETISTLVDQINGYLSTNKSALKSLGKLISHNYKTYSHCMNVFVYSTSVMLELNFDKKIIHHAGVGAMLHDIGKTRVPNYILNKPARLTDEEFTIVKNHPYDGLLLCQEMNVDEITANTVLAHHEKLDGSGYPNGEFDIPNYVRVITVADIFDALTAKRAYNKALAPFEAMKTILKEVERGRLDREITKMFVQVLSKNQFTI